MQLRCDEGDTVEELLDDCVLVLSVLLCDLGLLHLGLFVDGRLGGLGVACVLRTVRGA